AASAGGQAAPVLSVKCLLRRGDSPVHIRLAGSWNQSPWLCRKRIDRFEPFSRRRLNPGAVNKHPMLFHISHHTTSDCSNIVSTLGCVTAGGEIASNRFCFNVPSVNAGISAER